MLPRGQMNNIPALVQIMAWCRIGGVTPWTLHQQSERIWSYPSSHPTLPHYFQFPPHTAPLFPVPTPHCPTISSPHPHCPIISSSHAHTAPFFQFSRLHCPIISASPTRLGKSRNWSWHIPVMLTCCFTAVTSRGYIPYDSIHDFVLEHIKSFLRHCE